MGSMEAEAQAKVKEVDAAFQNWVKGKANSIMEAQMKANARPPSNVFPLSDARNAAEHYCEDDHIFALMDSLICGCEGTWSLLKRFFKIMNHQSSRIHPSFERAPIHPSLNVLEHHAKWEQHCISPELKLVQVCSCTLSLDG